MIVQDFPWRRSHFGYMQGACAELTDLSSSRAEIFQIIQDLSIFIPIQWYKYLILHVQNIFWDSHILQHSQSGLYSPFITYSSDFRFTDLLSPM